MRLTLADMRLRTRLPRLLGICQDNIADLAQMVNAAQQRLINAGGESGWWGGWQKVLFTATQASPYITLPREFARAINMASCRYPFRIQNEFYTLLPGGPGIPPSPTSSVDWCGEIQGYDVGTVPTLVDLPASSYLRIYATDAADVASGKRIFFTSIDQNSVPIFSQDGFNNANGFYLTCGTPFTDSTFQVSKIQGVSKDETKGRIILKAVDPTTLVETTLADYGPTETKPAYRRYQITALPTNCCPTTGATTVQITALCKLEYIPATIDTDWLIIQNEEAIILECQAIRFEEMDNTSADGKAARKHADAITQLKAQMRHYLGEQVPAVAIDRWEGQPLQYQSIGSMQ